MLLTRIRPVFLLVRFLFPMFFFGGNYSILSAVFDQKKSYIWEILSDRKEFLISCFVLHIQFLLVHKVLCLSIMGANVHWGGIMALVLIWIVVLLFGTVVTGYIYPVEYFCFNIVMYIVRDHIISTDEVVILGVWS